MPPYIRTVKMTCGATTVEVVYSSRRGPRGIEHIGSAQALHWEVSRSPVVSEAIEIMTNPTLFRDAQILQKAMHKSIAISPDAFLETVDGVDKKPISHWVNEIVSSTWAVIERGEDILGVAAAKWPNREVDIEDQDTTRFIESVWIAPELRGRRMAERLVKFLFEVECQKNPDIRLFLLWVLAENRPAIDLYRRMGFECTAVAKWLDHIGTAELKYQLTFDSAVVKAIGTAVNEAARQTDLREFGVRYRILGEDPAKSRPRCSRALGTDPKCGSLVR